MKSFSPENPILVIGSARSGTTWLAKLIDSHPAILYRHEPDSVTLSGGVPFLPEISDYKNLQSSAKGYFDALLETGSAKASGTAPFFHKTYRSSLGRAALILNIYITRLWERMPLAKPELAVFDFLKKKLRSQIRYMVKSVTSLWRTGLFSYAVPSLRIVHIVRHQCAVVASFLRGNRLGLMDGKAYVASLASTQEFSKYTLDASELLGAPIETQLAASWMLNNQKVNDELHGSPQYLLVKYEDLARNLPSQVTNLFGFLDLEQSAETAAFISALQASTATSPRYFSVLRSPKSALGTWRKELTDLQIARIRDTVIQCRLGQNYFS